MFFVVFVMAHLLGDFVLQTNKIAALKAKSTIGLSVHILIIGFVQVIVLVLVFGLGAIWPALIVTLIHFGIDYMKLRLRNKVKMTTAYYVFDQGLHLLIIYIATRVWRFPMTVFSIEKDFVLITIGLISSCYAGTILSKFLLLDFKVISSLNPFFEPKERGVDGMLALVMFLSLYFSTVFGLIVIMMIGCTYPMIQKRLFGLTLKGSLVKIMTYIGLVSLSQAMFVVA